MNGLFGIVTTANCFLRSLPGRREEQNDSGIEDEIFSGWAVRIFAETEENGWVRIETHYGYAGYVRLKQIMPVSREELTRRQDRGRFCRIAIGSADLLDCPKVQGIPLELLLKNAIVERRSGADDAGWCKIRTAAGREGYVRDRYLRERKEDDGYLLCVTADGGGNPAFRQDPAADAGENKKGAPYFVGRFLAAMPQEEQFREGLVQSARSYLGVPYRWGGKSYLGLDCSGLVFMSYLENGVLIYRDAKIMPGYPVREIAPEQVKPGDLIFFPGHVAMYLGNHHYLHATAFRETPFVTINSLDPEDKDYREDLAKTITGCGSVFAV